MVRHYKPKPGHRQYKKYDPELLDDAFKEIKNGNGSIAKIAKKYKIAKSVLHRHFRKKQNNIVTFQTALSLEREEHIIKYINACAPWEYYLMIWDIRLLVKFYLDKRPVISKRKLINNLPGQELVANFLKRHEDTISQRIIQNMNNNHTIPVEAVLSYFHELKMSIADVHPDNIVCYKDILLTDESDDIEKKEADEAKINDIFVMTAASASGEMLMPYVIYKEQNCYEMPKRTMSKQPYPKLSANIFEDWFKSIILPYYKGRSGKKCLIAGYFSSRISIDLLEICKEQNIDFIFLPHNSSNLTHPLDSMSQLIHKKWNDLQNQVKTDGNHSKNLEGSFRRILQDLTNNLNEKIIQGFRRTGICPINPSAVLKQLPDYNETTIENVDKEFEKLENIRNGNMDVVHIKEEMEWSDEYNDDDYDEEIASIENLITKDDNRHHVTITTPFKAKGRGKNSKNNETQITECGKTEDRVKLIGFDLKLSPLDFQVDLINPGTTVNYVTEKILKINESSVKSSQETQFTGKAEETSSYPNQHGLYHVQGISDVVDPLLNCQNSSNLHTTMATSDSTVEATSKSKHCDNGACNTHTQLLEAILSSVTRQEKLQERTALAMEAQTQALANIARLLEGRGAGDTSS